MRKLTTKEATPILEVCLMLCLCLIAIGWVVYPDYGQIYLMFVIAVGGMIFAKAKKMESFFILFIIAAIGTVIAPIIWAMIQGKDFVEIIGEKKIPFLEFSAQTYVITAIIIFFVVYAFKRIIQFTAAKS